MKLACVVHRFGADIAGGSESHCRAIAERLAARHDVTVLTSCAADHVTWQNVFQPGISAFGPLQVRRFPVVQSRSLHHFHDISQVAFSGRGTRAEQQQWFVENGPYAPDLVEYLRAHGAEYDRVLFWAFRYYPTFAGLPLVADRAILVPTAEDDPVARLDIVGPFFALPRAYLFLTPEEADLVGRRCAGPLPPSWIIGSGLEPMLPGPAAADLEEIGIVDPFLLYLGRIDPNKGCASLLSHFIRYQAEGGRAVQLVMAGPANMEIPVHPAIRRLGFVEDSVRESLLSRAAVLMMPSPFESLSLVLLEAWNHAVPALVNGRCDVLKGQARRANGALYYRRYEEFAAALDYLLAHPDEARQLGRQGGEYVDREYRWPQVMSRIEECLAAPRELT
jgi:glycosyltransferase involved in cell wall biosynthesis